MNFSVKYPCKKYLKDKTNKHSCKDGLHTFYATWAKTAQSDLSLSSLKSAVGGWIASLEPVQGCKRIRQWPINFYTCPMKIHKNNPSVDTIGGWSIGHYLNLPNNQNSRKVPKVYEYENVIIKLLGLV